MDIEQYAEHVHYYEPDAPIPILLENELKTKKFSSYLDLGCGDGSLLLGLSHRGLLDGKKIYAVDMSANRLERVKQNLQNLNVIKSDACNVTSINDSSVDFLTSTQVIEHVENDKAFVCEAHRLLAPQGMFYLSTVFKKWYGWYFYRCNGKWALDPTHVREYNEDAQLVLLLENQGFQILKQCKTLLFFPITDFFLKRFGFGVEVYKNPLLKLLRKIKVPIFGYYNWEFLCKKVRT